MADTTGEQTFTPNDPRKPWLWHPELPIELPPLFTWPLKPIAFLRWFCGRGFLLSVSWLYFGLAAIAWYFTPSLERMTTFEAGWIAEIWLRNAILFSVVTGGLHLWFHTFRGQGDTHKFDPKPLDVKSKKFLFGDQVWDNMFWSIVSGVTLVTAYEVLIWWCWANGYVGWLGFDDSPVWFLGFFFFIIVFETAHFYVVHRLLHWRPLYRFHDLHHSNVNIGPWSGLSMHPVEHVFYLSSLLLHVAIASHPLHMLFHSFYLTTGASVGHTGFQDLNVKGRKMVDTGTLFHQLHHRYYNCNYGQMLVPLDKWFGSFHDGTAEATTRIMKQNLRMKAGMPKAAAPASGSD
ncbi:MAG: sterol desaturase family protein [Rhodospirillales bacterium]|nr:sterol desaturase family protein [Rhodospirillales bacterium]